MGPIVLIPIILGGLFASSCKAKKSPNSQKDDKNVKKSGIVNKPGNKTLIDVAPDLYQPMDKHLTGWEKSNWPNGNPFNCTWKPECLSFNGGIMTIDLKKSSGKYPYISGEYRTGTETYKYGYYETRMKATKGKGLVAGTFFTYSGVWGQKNHNEIDFEVLGKDPTKVQINYFYAGSGKNSENEKIINLGFDATKGFHNYGFKWTKKSIEWYVDGKLIHSATENIPKGNSKIMVNFWPGTSEVSGWLGGVYKGSGGQVQYDWIKYISLDKGSVIEMEQPMPQVEKQATAQKTGRALGEFVSSSDPFNGASGDITEDKINLQANSSSDAGLAVNLKKTIDGKLTFDYTGKVSGGSRDNGFTIIFIKSGPGGDWRKDKQLGEKSFVPSKNTKRAEVDIPKGTNKINVMLIGRGSINIDLKNVKINK